MTNPYLSWPTERLEFELNRLRFLNRTYVEKRDKDEAINRIRLIYDALRTKINAS